MILLFCPLHYTHNTTPQSQPRKHGRGTRGAAPASDVARRGMWCPTRLPARRTASAFFFFLGFALTRLDSRRCGSIRADAARFVPNRLRFAPNRADSAKIGPYRPAADIADTAETGRKQAETGRKRPKSALSMAVKSETCILLSFFVNQGLVCVFKKYFNSKNIYKI